MELQIVNIRQAGLLKMFGFRWKTLHWYNDNERESEKPLLFIGDEVKNHNGYDCSRISAPTVALALQWLRHEKKYKMCICEYRGDTIKTSYGNVTDDKWGRAETYEEAEIALLDMLLEIIEAKFYEDVGVEKEVRLEDEKIFK